MGKMIKPVSQAFLLPVAVICNLRMQMATHLQIMLPHDRRDPSCYI